VLKFKELKPLQECSGREETKTAQEEKKKLTADFGDKGKDTDMKEAVLREFI
jgi:hypothetical protein